jgi:hypothetical protein
LLRVVSEECRPGDAGRLIERISFARLR